MLTSDLLRQRLNLTLALLMPLTAYLAFAGQAGFDEATASPAGEALIAPAQYAFVIWSLIYAACIGYGLYQARPSLADDLLLRRIGYFTAAAFAGTVAWLVAARLGLVWLTVLCIVWMAAGLAGAFVGVARHAPGLSAAQHWLVSVPVSVFAGWISVAVFANTAAAVKQSGGFGGGPAEATWTVLLLLVATAFTSLVVLASRGNVAYACTVLWALVAIAAANMDGRAPVAVALTAALGALTVGGVLVVAMLQQPP